MLFRSVDSDVIFAGWVNGDELVYIREIPGTQKNILCRYNRRYGRRAELRRFDGAVTHARISGNGRYLVIKRLIQRDRLIPEGELLVVNILSNSLTVLKSPSPFLDFTVSPDGGSLLQEGSGGIWETSFYTGMRRMTLKKGQYRGILHSSNPSLAFLSPDGNKCLVINGGGGSYNGAILAGGGARKIRGITASSEVWWIDNTQIAYRRGYTGNFSVVLHRLSDDTRRTLVDYSLNTNLHYSYQARMMSFLKDGIICLYGMGERKLLRTGLEGEDISFDPNGQYFTSLVFRKLFILNLGKVRRRQIEMKRSWGIILSLYEKLKLHTGEYENEYSGEYINRKVRLYRDLIRGAE